MQAVTPKPNVLLLDDEAARLVRSKGVEVVLTPKTWKRWPWATGIARFEDPAEAKRIKGIVEEYRQDVEPVDIP